MANASGKTALITGASVGIGRDLAGLFAMDGHGLILTARNEKQLNELAAKIRAEHGTPVDIIPKDLAEPGAPQQIFDQIVSRGIAVDFLVNNAGFGAHGPFAESDISEQLAMLQVNIVALTHLTRLFLPEMLARKRGRVLNVASTAAFVPGPYMAGYYASKAFVLSFSEAVDAELAGTGVTITALCPGPTATEFHKRAGIANSKLFKGKTMSSIEVAEIGYRAMLAGKRTVVAGLRNKILTTSTRFVPRKAVTAITRNLNKDR
ncbi:MAG: SDR family oxidoreductase [Planctomycetota bacterium]|nr:SDR family oxidoreductase [Planctomycetota bacterium]